MFLLTALLEPILLTEWQSEVLDRLALVVTYFSGAVRGRAKWYSLGFTGEVEAIYHSNLRKCVDKHSNWLVIDVFSIQILLYYQLN